MNKVRKPLPPAFTQRSVFLPRQLWKRVEELAAETGKETSELVADGLRLLLAGGLPAAPASIGGTLRSAIRDGDEAPRIAPRPHVVSGAIESRLDEVKAETITSPKLRERLLQVMTAVEEKDLFINRHSESVAEMAKRTAEVLGLDTETVAAVEIGAIAHDIGKNRIPEEILGKRGRLTPEEWALVKQYPEFSAEIVERFEHLSPVVEIVRHHQERWDGTGYPAALQGDGIPIGAQIVGICDVYDVLTSERAYRPALPSDIARRTIEGAVERLWNPRVAEAFLNQVLGG